MAVLYSFAPENCPPAAATNFARFQNPMVGGAYRSCLAFDSVVSQKCRSIAFRMPIFTGALTLKVRFEIAAITGNVQFRAAVEANKSNANRNLSTTSYFSTTNSSGSVSVPATTFNPKDFTITLTNNDTAAAGDEVTITLDRDVTVGTNATGDCYITSFSLEDAS